MRLIEVIDYRPEWPERFQREADALTEALDDTLVAVHHIGSTAVPGLAAKPIIDMVLEVRDLSALDAQNPAMAALGYTAMGEYGIARRRFFTKGGDQRSHHVHAFPTGDSEVHRHLAFRDYLRGNPDIARDYDTLKRRVARDCQHDSERYGAGKAEFVRYHEARALRALDH